MENDPSTLASIIDVKRKIFLVVIVLFVICNKQEVYATEIEDLKVTSVMEEEELAETVEQQDPIDYTEEELMLLATVIYAEAGNCNDMEKYRVGNVVLNRLMDVEHSEFKHVNSIMDVIYQENQFVSVGGTAWERGPKESEIKIAQELLEGKRVLPEYVVWFSKKKIFGEDYYTSKWHVFSGWPQEEMEGNISPLFFI